MSNTPTALTHRQSVAGRPDRSDVSLVQDLPSLVDVQEGTGDLSAMERANLAAAETALDTFNAAGWAAGQALAVIAKGHLHRATHPNFVDYLWDRWGMKSSPAYRLMDGWHLAALLAPATTGKAVTASHVTSLLPVAKKADEDMAVAVFTGAQDAVKKAGGKDRKVTAVLLDAAVAAIPTVLPEDQGERDRLVRAAAFEAVTSQIRETEPPGTDTEEQEEEAPARTSVRLAAEVPTHLAEVLDDWAGRLAAGLSLPALSRESVLARIVELATEQPESMLAIARRIEAEHAEKVGGARRWTWSPSRNAVRIAEEKPKGWPPLAGQEEKPGCFSVLGRANAGLPLCETTARWRITDHPSGRTAQVVTAFYCTDHLPADASPPGRWTG
jgi:hypothetical protein